MCTIFSNILHISIFIHTFAGERWNGMHHDESFLTQQVGVKRFPINRPSVAAGALRVISRWSHFVQKPPLKQRSPYFRWEIEKWSATFKKKSCGYSLRLILLLCYYTPMSHNGFYKPKSVWWTKDEHPYTNIFMSLYWLMIKELTAVKGLRYNKQVGWRENVICNEKDEFVQFDTVSWNSIKLCLANNNVKMLALHHSASFTFRQRSGHSFVLFPKRVGNQRIPSESLLLSVGAIITREFPSSSSRYTWPLCCANASGRCLSDRISFSRRNITK